jgi:filamentous hemagglutinin
MAVGKGGKNLSQQSTGSGTGGSGKDPRPQQTIKQGTTGAGKGTNGSSTPSTDDTPTTALNPRLYRVQGGGAPGSTTGPVSKPIVQVDASGNVDIEKRTLNVSDREHAEYFLKDKRPGAQVVSFEIPDWMYKLIEENAIPQRGYKTNPRNQGGLAPKIVDPHQPGKSFELPPIWADWLQQNHVKGSGTPAPSRPPPNK